MKTARTLGIIGGILYFFACAFGGAESKLENLGAGSVWLGLMEKLFRVLVLEPFLRLALAAAPAGGGARSLFADWLMVRVCWPVSQAGYVSNVKPRATEVASITGMNTNRQSGVEAPARLASQTSAILANGSSEERRLEGSPGAPITGRRFTELQFHCGIGTQQTLTPHARSERLQFAATKGPEICKP